MASKFTVPYAPSSVYRANNSIAELMLRAGAVNAEGARRSGEIWGSTIANLGQQVGGAVAQYQQEKQAKQAEQEMARQDAAFVGLLSKSDGIPDPRAVIGIYGPKRGMEVAKGLAAFGELGQKRGEEALKSLPTVIRGAQALSEPLRAKMYPILRERAVATGLFPPEAIPEQYDPETWGQMVQFGQSLEAQKPEAGFTLSPGQVRYDASGKEIAAGPVEPPKPPTSIDAAILEADRAGNVVEVKRLTALKAQTEQAGRKPDQPARMWVNRNGQLIRIAESEYQPGDQPANIREQGRPVTSGDAGRIADLDTSLDDLNALSKTLSGNKATGTAAKVGASLPNAVTDILGWGVEAKQKQATIDRVKQVIGKALEGGVLRKEDEYKYEKILPTIGDPAEVVKSKLDGLWKAIQLRRQTTLDSLADAGYDTSKFAARAPRERAAAVTVTAPNGKTYSFKNKAEADAFKKRAGIP